ncbi:YdbL family protein [Desulfosarcina sp.]|uniref:YdbL family protein n=1 Tax=Desulfosarcina sp. TaxID=2027861 RepID=UPI0029A0E514|nr:YdbL family protein [Desulfosarcina sp.]MDX2452518.1 YdbL family protein [Desulfosarcina sp.]MDX2490292.1 YdbL family protein [Desulfosarcina sp.]
MNQTRYLWFMATVVVGVFLFSASACCGDIKQRMKDRLPRIIELKAAGIIGENSQGLLAFVGGDRQEQALVEAENKDRQLVYRAIAQQQGTTAAVVGQRRALQIAEKAKPGEWLQDAGGKWVQK